MWQADEEEQALFASNARMCQELLLTLVNDTRLQALLMVARHEFQGVWCLRAARFLLVQHVGPLTALCRRVDTGVGVSHGAVGARGQRYRQHGRDEAWADRRQRSDISTERDCGETVGGQAGGAG